MSIVYPSVKTMIRNAERNMLDLGIPVDGIVEGDVVGPAIVHDNDCNCGCANDFQPADRPSIATLYIRWMDRCLPSHTWADWLRQYNEMYGDTPRPVEHSHNSTLSCFPSCPRWGA